MAGRPPGFEGKSQRRPENGFTYQQVSDLLSILADRGNPNHVKAFDWVLDWAYSDDLSPKKVLRNVPEYIVNHYGFRNRDALADKRFRWEWLIESFLYKEDRNPENTHWYIEGPSKDKKDKASESSGSKRDTDSSTHRSDHSRRTLGSSSHQSGKPPRKKR
ncbi:predicted protein [Sclerotinia sclerotiorum 1980 UF-70]|uniref:Uncharacterized protein n=1 Tax=Sclerotinia sclerotiorum (strain ATCC 18683 / 1980 / Ss-1) TaxID=665079 RepID=A7EUM8_SCLS1|nr:predicted protein [Sclerotinia sclerotiorum 1980 UF-70]EDN93170.1 predicted protein [Sclerotinia sclerotiorum 1980 UF-70]